MITRFSVLPDDRRVLIGLDKKEIFEPGIVYEVVKILDEILIRPIGEYALKSAYHPNENSTINAIVCSKGLHIMTKEEQKNLE